MLANEGKQRANAKYDGEQAGGSQSGSGQIGNAFLSHDQADVFGKIVAGEQGFGKRGQPGCGQQHRDAVFRQPGGG